MSKRKTLINIEPCPFCAADEALVAVQPEGFFLPPDGDAEEFVVDGPLTFIFCPSCMGCGPRVKGEHGYETTTVAAEKWNARGAA